MARTTPEALASSLVVELVGAPGSGKSTLVPEVRRIARSMGLHPFTVVEAARAFASRTWPGRLAAAVLPRRLHRAALWAVFLLFRALCAGAFAVRHPRLVGYVIATQHGRPRAARRQRRVIHWYVRLAGAYRFLTRHAGDREVLLLDEGFVHRVVQLHASTVEAPDRTLIDGYVDLVPRPDLLIHVRAPADVCERRVRSRGVWDRFQHRKPEEVGRFVANAHRATELVVGAARARGWAVIDVDNSGDLAAATSDLAPRLAGALAEPVPGVPR